MAGMDLAGVVLVAVLAAALGAVIGWWIGAGRSGHVPAAGVIDSVVAVADERLGATREVIDLQLRGLSGELRRMNETVTRLDADRGRQHGELSAQLRATVDQTAQLTATTGALRDVLANPQARGQWGERMAEDVLRAAGLVEGFSYRKQRALPGGTIPDFTFLLPNERVLHMDAKFPVANYARYLEADTDHERAGYAAAFLRDVRARVHELGGRDYVDPANGTLDYALAFIPNESIYAFIHDHDPTLVDVALRRQVVLCSPLSLFAVLAVIRQAADAAAVGRASGEILSVLGAFDRQWDRFCVSLDKVGRALDGADRAFRELSGPRRRALERPLARVGELRREAGLPEVDAPDDAGDDEECSATATEGPTSLARWRLPST